MLMSATILSTVGNVIDELLDLTITASGLTTELEQQTTPPSFG
jgi:hypothetical protein